MRCWTGVAFALLTISYAPTAGNRNVGTADLLRENPQLRVLRSDSGQIARIYGPAFGSAATAELAAQRFVERYSADLLGVPPQNLQFRGTQNVRSGTFTAVYYDQYYQGLPVHEAWLTVLARHDAGNGIVLVSPVLYDLRHQPAPPVLLTADAAVGLVAAQYPDFAFTVPQRVVYPDNGVPRFAYRFVGGNGLLATPEKYEFVVDAGDPQGRVLYQESRVYFEDVSGNVSAWATPGDRPDVPSNPPLEFALDQLRVRLLGGGFGQTNAAGDYLIPHGGADPVTVEASFFGQGPEFAGPWATVYDVTTESAESISQSITPPGPADFTFNAAPDEHRTAQANVYIHTTIVHDFVKGINPDYPGVDVQMPCIVNISQTCNAFYDRDPLSINFFAAGGSCPNTAYSGVIYHEYGHHIVASGHAAAPADYHEGMADTTANFLIDTECTGREFQPPEPCLRHGYNSVSYPCGDKDSHRRGQSVSGAYWLLREMLADTEPVDALDIARQLYLNAILLQPQIISHALAVDVLTLDDDDADLTNGTPHYLEITTAFSKHNMNAPAALQFSYPVGRPAKLSPLGGTPLRVAVASGGLELLPQSVTLSYSTGGDFIDVPMSLTGSEDYQAEWPALPCGATVSYYVSALAANGLILTDPPAAPLGSHLAHVAYAVAQPLADSFETSGGWSVENVGSATGGWTRVNPIVALEGHAVVSPEDDATAGDGSFCYVTGASSRCRDAELGDLDGGPTRLISPRLALAGTDPLASFYHWLYSSAGDDEIAVDVSNDDGTSWVPLGTLGPVTAWTLSEIRLADYVAPTNLVRLRFSVVDTGADTLTDAGLDDVRVVVPSCSNPFGKGDMDCDGQVTNADIRGFVLALTDRAAFSARYDGCDFHNADMNDDGFFNGIDIQAFIATLTD